MSNGAEILVDVLSAAEAARDRADKAMARYGRSRGQDRDAIKVANGEMRDLRFHITEALRLASQA